jgi:hypothetical protein
VDLVLSSALLEAAVDLAAAAHMNSKRGGPRGQEIIELSFVVTCPVICEVN